MKTQRIEPERLREVVATLVHNGGIGFLDPGAPWRLPMRLNFASRESRYGVLAGRHLGMVGEVIHDTHADLCRGCEAVVELMHQGHPPYWGDESGSPLAVAVAWKCPKLTSFGYHALKEHLASGQRRRRVLIVGMSCDPDPMSKAVANLGAQIEVVGAASFVGNGKVQLPNGRPWNSVFSSRKALLRFCLAENMVPRKYRGIVVNYLDHTH